MWKIVGPARLCEFYPGICLTNKKKHGKTSVRVRKTSDRLRKTSVRVECTYYQNTHILQNPHKHTHYKTLTSTHITETSIQCFNQGKAFSKIQ
jgi:hypothetical protein